MSRRESCPVCDQMGPEALDQRHRVPIAQNVMYRTEAAAVACPTGILDVVRCMSCGFAWNAAFDPDAIPYDEEYENNQSLSPAFVLHLDQVVALISERTPDISKTTVLEVGCGQGYFLHRLAALFPDATLIGFDPSYRSSSPLPQGVRVERAYFNNSTRDLVGIQPDVLVTRHTIEHIANPLDFLRSLRAVASAGTTVFVETPSIQWILDGGVAHDLYYEHCSIFDAEALRFALERAGFFVDEVRHMLDGQYLLAIARAGNPEPRARTSTVDNADYPARKAAYVERWRASIRRDAAAGTVSALWGGASKGVTLSVLIGREGIKSAIDINPARATSFMALTGVPVISPDEARRAGVQKAYVMNPAYLSEIRSQCAAMGWSLELVPVE